MSEAIEIVMFVSGAAVGAIIVYGIVARRLNEYVDSLSDGKSPLYWKREAINLRNRIAEMEYTHERQLINLIKDRDGLREELYKAREYMSRIPEGRLPRRVERLFPPEVFEPIKEPLPKLKMPEIESVNIKIPFGNWIENKYSHLTKKSFAAMIRTKKIGEKYDEKGEPL